MDLLKSKQDSVSCLLATEMWTACLFLLCWGIYLKQWVEACCPFPGINAGSLFKKELLNLLSPVQTRSCECRQKQGVGTPGMTPASPRHVVAKWNPPEFSSNNYVGVSLLGEVYVEAYGEDNEGERITTFVRSDCC